MERKSTMVYQISKWKWQFKLDSQVACIIGVGTLTLAIWQFNLILPKKNKYIFPFILFIQVINIIFSLFELPHPFFMGSFAFLCVCGCACTPVSLSSLHFHDHRLVRLTFPPSLNFLDSFANCYPSLSLITTPLSLFFHLSLYIFCTVSLSLETYPTNLTIPPMYLCM